MSITNPIEKRLTSLTKKIGGEVRISKRGVPHIVIAKGDTTYSIAYMGRKRFWRVFYPYPSNNQKKKNFSNIEQLQLFFNQL